MTKLNHCRINSFEHPIPEGFVDISYDNDMCASIFSENKLLKIFIDHINPEEREDPEMERFAIFKTDEYGETGELLFETDNWQYIIDHLKQ